MYVLIFYVPEDHLESICEYFQQTVRSRCTKYGVFFKGADMVTSSFISANEPT